MHKLITRQDAIPRKIAENKTAYNYISKEISPGVSFAVIEGTNYNAPVTAAQNWIYFMVDGDMTLRFKDEVITLHEDDACLVTKGEQYQMIGTYKAVIVCQPAFGTS